MFVYIYIYIYMFSCVIYYVLMFAAPPRAWSTYIYGQLSKVRSGKIGPAPG